MVLVMRLRPLKGQTLKSRTLENGNSPNEDDDVDIKGSIHLSIPTTLVMIR